MCFGVQMMRNWRCIVESSLDSFCTEGWTAQGTSARKTACASVPCHDVGPQPSVSGQLQQQVWRGCARLLHEGPEFVFLSSFQDVWWYFYLAQEKASITPADHSKKIPTTSKINAVEVPSSRSPSRASSEECGRQHDLEL